MGTIPEAQGLYSNAVEMLKLFIISSLLLYPLMSKMAIRMELDRFFIAEKIVVTTIGKLEEGKVIRKQTTIKCSCLVFQKQKHVHGCCGFMALSRMSQISTNHVAETLGTLRISWKTFAHLSFSFEFVTTQIYTSPDSIFLRHCQTISAVDWEQDCYANKTKQ